MISARTIQFHHGKHHKAYVDKTNEMVAGTPMAGMSLEDVVRVTYVLPNGSEFEQCWPVLRKYFGEVRPAAMMISAGLADSRMKIEIEVTALKRER